MREPPKTYEAEANMIDDAIVYLSLSNSGVGKEHNILFSGFKESTFAAIQEMRSLGLDIGDLNHKEMMPLDSYQLLGPTNVEADVFTLQNVHRPGYMERTKAKLFTGGVIANRFLTCTTRETRISKAGVAIPGELIKWQFGSGVWMPVDSKHQTVGRKTTIYNWKKGEYIDRNIITSKLEPIPDLAVFGEWARRACWTIQFRIGESPSIVTTTDPTGVQAFLRMRDVPEGRNRREALRHWVKEHWRQNRKDESLEHRVKEHLRGTAKCDWFGMNCLVVPSRIDEAKNMLVPHKKHRPRTKRS